MDRAFISKRSTLPCRVMVSTSRLGASWSMLSITARSSPFGPSVIFNTRRNFTSPSFNVLSQFPVMLGVCPKLLRQRVTIRVVSAALIFMVLSNGLDRINKIIPDVHDYCLTAHGASKYFNHVMKSANSNQVI